MATTHAFFVAPIGPGSGLTSTCLGLVRALDRLGLRVRFYKPVRQPGKSQGPERSTEFVRRTTEFEPPEPFAFEAVESYLQAGGRDVLLEEIIGRYRQVAEGAEVVIVEGLVPTSDRPDAADLNRAVARALDAEIILVGVVGDGGFDELNDRLELNAEAFGGVRDDKVLGAIINRLGDPRVVTGSVRAARSEAEGVVDVDTLRARLPIFERDRFRLLGAVPWEQSLVSPRARDVAVHLGARVLNEGEIDRRRVVDVSLCARTVANMTHRLGPDALIITPADRDDVILATCMAALNGVPIAALLLTSGLEPDSRTVSLCARAFATGLPVLLVDTDSYMTAARVIAMDPEVPLDDTERIEAVMNTVAGYLDSEWLQARLATDLEPRQSPAAFRFRLVTRAREADRRIVLPEGEEARTVQAAATCQARGIARCLLLGKRERVLHQARSQGLSLPDGIEIVDPDEVRERYVQPMVRLREHKGLTAPMALGQLEDNVVLGTMMLSEGEVDGLVSGALHTTANTVRPALQLIKTRPGAKLISSIFFMLLPEQVLIFGDCAINPDPGAEELADIAIQSAESARAFGVPPRVAMISYSTLASGSGVDVDKVREATQLVRERRPDLAIDGPLQYDAATTASVARTKAPDSPVAGRATVLIFPDLNTGNTTYKAVQRSAGVVSIGPMLQGLRRPVNDLSRGATVEDIVYTIALTAIQAAQGEEPRSSVEAGGDRTPGGRP